MQINYILKLTLYISKILMHCFIHSDMLSQGKKISVVYFSNITHYRAKICSPYTYMSIYANNKYSALL